VVIWSFDGRLIARLESSVRGGATGRVVWNGRDDAGREVPPGVYFVSAEGGATTRTKIVKLK
jgi:hypothetical protein